MCPYQWRIVQVGKERPCERVEALAPRATAEILEEINDILQERISELRKVLLAKQLRKVEQGQG